MSGEPRIVARMSTPAGVRLTSGERVAVELAYGGARLVLIAQAREGGCRFELVAGHGPALARGELGAKGTP